MQPPSQVLAPWHDFYMLFGEASATMTGLLFVALSVRSGPFSPNRPGALRMFFSASVVQFGSIVTASLIVLAPLQRWQVLGGLIFACGVFGLGYSAIAWQGTVRDGVSAKIDLEDRIWYAVLPTVGYLCESLAGIALFLASDFGSTALAVAMGTLLVAAIHNAWDITVWSVTRRSE
jgi:modulator of FtsH protease